MSESILDLTFDDRGERVGELQDSLITLGHEIPEIEAKAKLFGLGTGEALRAFQRKSRLRVTGKVDKRTETALVRNVTAAKDNKNIIEGRILLENGLPAKNLTLRFKTHTLAPAKQSSKAKTRELGSKAEFGRAKTDERGFFIFSFDPDKARNVEVVAESEDGEEVSLSKTKYNPERHEVLNLVAPASLQPLAPEYDRLVADVEKAIGDPKDLANAKEDDEHRDLTLLHQATGWDARQIALLATVVRLGEEIRVPIGFLYALLRLGLPSDKELLCMLDKETIDRAVSKAERSGYVKLDTGEIAAGKRAFTRFAQATQPNTKAPGAVSTAKELLDGVELGSTERKTLETLYFSHRGKASELWEKAAEEGISPPSIDKLKVWRKLNLLTHDNARLTATLQGEIGTTDELEKLVDLDLFRPEAWKDRIKALEGDEQVLGKLIPPGHMGETLDERLDSYAGTLAYKVSESFRTQVIGRKVKSGELGRDLDGDDEMRALVGDFLGTAPNLGFRLGSTPVGAFVKRHGDKLELDSGRLDAALPHLKRLHCLYQITPSDAALEALDKLPYDAAEQIAAIDPEKFVAQHRHQFHSEQEVRMVTLKSQQVSAGMLNFLTNAKLAAGGLPVYVMSGTEGERRRDIARMEKAHGDYPTVESLFGSVDFCDCEHCRSMLSPAAYFVDLLQFLDPDDASWDKPYSKPYAILEARRPDLPHLALTCENTNTALPYIDIVNEILEYAVVNNELQGDAAHDTGEATTPELLAEPHYIEPEAYEILRDPNRAIYPVGLPFDLWLETVRAFLDHFKTPYWRVLDAFRTCDELVSGIDEHPTYTDSSYCRAAVLAETLGLSLGEYELFSVRHPLKWYELYGYSDVSETEELHFARTLARRLNVSYLELADIVRTRFINPELHELSLLWRLGIDPSDALVYLDEGTPEEEKAALERRIKAAIVEIESDEDLILEKQQFVIDEMRALNAPGESGQLSSFKRTLVLRDTSAQCRFDQTRLEFADPSDRADLHPDYQLVFLKLNLFVRLWKKLGWGIEETDQALCLFLPKPTEDLTGQNMGVAIRASLVGLARFQALADAIGVKGDGRQRLLTLWSDLPTTGPRSLYARLFLTPSMQKIDPIFNDPFGNYLSFQGQDGIFVPFEWDPTVRKPVDDRNAGRVALENHLLALQGALGLTAKEIDLILEDAVRGLAVFAPPETEPPLISRDEPNAMRRGALTLENVSLLHRYAVLGRALHLSITELITLKKLSGIDPFRKIDQSGSLEPTDDDPMSETLRFVETVQQVQESDFEIDDLDYLLNHELDAVGKYREATVPPLLLLKTLGAEIRRIQDEYAVPADPASLTEESLREKLALVLPAEVVDTLTVMWLGTIEYEAVETGVEADDHLNPERFRDRPHLRVIYDEAQKTQRMIVRGVVLDADLVRLSDEVSATLASALTGYHEQAKAFFVKHLQRDVNFSEGATFGFLEEDDFDTLFARPEPVSGNLSADEITANIEANEAARRAKLERLGNAFLPYLQDTLIRRVIVEKLSAEFGADPTLIQALVVDTRLLEDPVSSGEPLLSAFRSGGDRGVTATGRSTRDNALNATSVPTPDARLLVLEEEDEDVDQVQFEGYLEVPATAAYRLIVQFEHAGGQVALYFGDEPNPLLSDTASDANLRDGIASPIVELKAGVPYRIDLDFTALNGTHAELLIQGEGLPIGQLSRLVLYPRSAVDRFARAKILLSKALLFIRGFGLGERELRYLIGHPEDFGKIDLRQFPTIASDSPIADAKARTLFSQFLWIADYARLREDMAAGEGLIDVFEHARRETGDVATANQDLYELLAAITRRDAATVQAAAEHLGFGFQADDPETRPLVAVGLTQVQGIRRVWEILQIAERLGATVEDIARWASPPHPNLDIVPPTLDTARDLKNTIKARYRPEDWQRIAQPIFNRLRRHKRDALVGYLMHAYPRTADTHGFESMEELFEHFLIDPGMEPIVQTSRIQLAIASVQTFVQRCLLNLESDVPPAAIDAEQWKWMKHYRVWEANRKIFLYPENWLEPEFRDDKTHLFQQFESTLLQGDVTDRAAEAALSDYLKGLETIAKLDIVTACREPDPHNATAFTIHVIGRTSNTPNRHFYRRYTSTNTWTPWEPVSVEINSEHVVAVVWKRRLHLFWVTWVSEPEKDPNPETGDDTGEGVGEKSTSQVVHEASAYTREIVKAQLNWCEYFQGKWTDPETSSLENAVSGIIPDGVELDRRKIFIHATKEIDPDTGEDGRLGIHLVGDDFEGQYKSNETAYYVANKNIAPIVAPQIPPSEYPFYFDEVEASRYKGSGSFQWASARLQDIILSEGRLRDVSVHAPDQIVFGSAREFYLAFCSRSHYMSRFFSRLFDPFFYQDDEHSFFVTPSLEPAAIDKGEDDDVHGLTWIRHNQIMGLVAEAEEEAGIVGIPPGDNPAPLVVSDEAIHTISTSLDWLTHPATLLEYNGRWIADHGVVDHGEVPDAVGPNAGVALPPAAISGAHSRLNLVGSGGLDPAALARLRTLHSDLHSESGRRSRGRLPD